MLLAKTTNEMEAMYKQGFIEETDVDQLKINKSNHRDNYQDS